MIGDTTSVTRKVGSHRLPDGREIVLYGFSFLEWSMAAEAALAYFKRAKIKTWSENLDLMPKEMQVDELRRVYREAEKVTLADLPVMKVRIPVDQSPEGNGQPAYRDQEVDYTTWWSSETMEGKLHCAWLSARKAPGQETWTKEHLSDLFYQAADAAAQIEEAAQTVGRLSQPDPELLKNSSAPQPAGTVTGNQQVPLAIPEMTPRQRRILARQQKQQNTQG